MTGDGVGLADLLAHAPAQPVAVITMNTDGVVIEFSRQAEAMFGYQRAEAIGARLSELIIPPRLRAAHEAGFARYLQSGVGPLFDQTFELPAVRADGSELTIELVVTPLKLAGEQVFTGVIREAGRSAPIVQGELALSRAFFRTLIARSPIAVSVVEPDGSWRWSSEAGLRLHGELGSSSYAAIVPEEDRRRLLELIESVADGETGCPPVDLRLRDLDGTWHALSVAAENMLTEPAVHGVGIYATDTTRLVEAEKRGMHEGARLSTLIDSLSTGILFLDPSHRVVLLNCAFTDLFGVDAEPAELIGQPVGAIVATNEFADQHAADIRGYEILEAGEAATGEEWPLGDGRVVERDYIPVQLAGATLGHLWVFHDITGQIQTRRGLEEQNRALEELASLKTEFIATASHELRTPLTSILTFAHLIEEPGAGPAEHERALGAITRNADRMLRLVDDLILLATLEAGTAPLRLLPVDLPELVTGVMETWRPVASGTSVTISGDLGKGPRMQADARYLTQLIDTLLGTATARTPRGGQITVGVSYAEPIWTLSIECTGSGASGDHIFTRPGRHDDPSAAHSNALALLLSRAIVTRYGGQMTSPSEERGLQYVVRLPLVPPEAEPEL